jgi:hypothetical protein
MTQRSPPFTNYLYGGGVCITDVDQLPQILKGDQFKVLGQYESELAKIKQFGKGIWAYLAR